MNHESNLSEIEALTDAGSFDQAAKRIRSSLPRVTETITRARYLMSLIVCLSNLDTEDETASALNELYRLTLPPDWRSVRNFTAALSYMHFVNPVKAVELLRENLNGEWLQGKEATEQRYENLAYLGFALSQNGEPHEALRVFSEAELLNPLGSLHTEILLYVVKCTAKVGNLDAAFGMAARIAETESPDVSARALFHMAEIRLLQERYREALEFYKNVESRLPCDGVSLSDVRRGMADALRASPV